MTAKFITPKSKRRRTLFPEGQYSAQNRTTEVGSIGKGPGLLFAVIVQRAKYTHCCSRVAGPGLLLAAVGRMAGPRLLLAAVGRMADPGLLLAAVGRIAVPGLLLATVLKPQQNQESMAKTAFQRKCNFPRQLRIEAQDGEYYFQQSSQYPLYRLK